MDKREQNAIDIGFEGFWEKPLRDLDLFEKAYAQRRRTELQLKARMEYNNQMVLGSVISKVINGSGSIPELETLYPTLFDKKEGTISAEHDTDLQRRVAGFKAFAQVFNLQHNKKRGGVNDNRRTESSD